MQLGSEREAAKDAQSYHRKAIATWSRRQLRTESRTQGLHRTMHDIMQMINELVRVLTCDYYTAPDSVGYGWESFHVRRFEEALVQVEGFVWGRRVLLMIVSRKSRNWSWW